MFFNATRSKVTRDGKDFPPDDKCKNIFYERQNSWSRVAFNNSIALSRLRACDTRAMDTWYKERENKECQNAKVMADAFIDQTEDIRGAWKFGIFRRCLSIRFSVRKRVPPMVTSSNRYRIK